MHGLTASQLLGYPLDARLLIINADDFGMCHAVNQAIVGTLEAGVVRSTSLMVPCPGTAEAIHFLAEHREIPFGVHLTAISDSFHNRWQPLTAREKVPSLLDEQGYFYDFDHMPAFMARVRLDQLAAEFRAQIETVLAAGLQPAHLDWHSLRIRDRVDIFDLIFRLAREYGLALRVAYQPWINRLQDQGLPFNDYETLDSYLLDPAAKAARFAALLRALPPGLSEWAVHPGLDSAELLALEPGGSGIRQADFDFLTSREAKELVREESITLLDYRALQAVWKHTPSA